MSDRTIQMTPSLAEYVFTNSVREPGILCALRAETAERTGERSRMQISPEQGQFMRLLVRLLGARRTIECGVFTGYSSLSVALELPDDGFIVACDVSDEWTGIARRYWAEAGVANKIDLRLAPALDTLDGLIADGEAGTYDFAFIDADKVNYEGYFDRCLTLLRAGGVIAVDNTLWSGRVADPSVDDADTVAIRAFNAARHRDERIELSVLPVGDGLTLCLKR